MEVDKTKLTELLVAMCHRPIVRTSKKRRWTHTANAATARKLKNCLNNKHE